MKYSDIYRLYSTSQPKDAIHQALREVPVDDSDEQYEDRSPLHLACQYGDTEGVKILLERDAEPNTKDANGSTPIHILGRTSAGCADEDKLKEIAVMLIEQGANIPRSAKNTTALIECIRNRHFKMAEAIIDSGARVNSTDLNGENVLFGFLCRFRRHQKGYPVREKGTGRIRTIPLPRKQDRGNQEQDCKAGG